ncbi:Bifunctional DNA primase/polymerase, N-terminal [Saccharopolyspora antimicrobica]|uniref:Bifunctional DNA primase/polymerase, N-terminal n=1 Tax=Saccharopolyspora antimicrobica TaxID=455193 RepID=A0A1I4QB94_9PSEU|nr:bifunctional DNA primase/polymerase [Saccharopolyspora antimicrobica]RKT84856.1 bifunctional DNA primase/polymerase-like protein [Saccharopolyspora antimicrobica]SFM37317.1 Bifunctional DNA primase/polymerase, N-terminal [Saccharopolyspora antimicrobica]
MTTPLHVASWLASHGLYVFPLRPFSKRPFGNCSHCRADECTPAECECLNADRPCHGLLAATTEPELIRRWWARTPRANVGIATGPSGLVVLDLDRKDKPPAPAAHDVPDVVADGLGALHAITTAEGVQWPDTLTIATPSEGRHLYFRADGAQVPSDATGRVGHQIDIRAEGGYVVAPSCETAAPPEDAFGAYNRVSTTTEIGPLPEWLRSRVVLPAPRTLTTPKALNLGGIQPGSHARGYWDQVWDGELHKVETLDGERWRIVYNSARRLANLATHDHAPWSELDVIEALVAAAVRRRQRTGKPIEQATAQRNASRGWQRGIHDGPDSLRGLATA